MPQKAVALRIPDAPGELSLIVHDERDRFVSQRIREEGIWEPFETSLVLSILGPGDVFVDVGANVGYFSVLAAAAVAGGGSVIAFEPDPSNFLLLQQNAALNGFAGDILCVEAALSDAPADGQLFLSEDNLGDHQIFAGEEQRESVPIKMLCGAEFLGERLSRLDLLKVDTQGSEYHVISGLMPWLRHVGGRRRIMIELTPYALRESGASGRALIELLATLEHPMWIIDHIEHRLAPSTAADLALWCDNVDAWEGDRGFMNILVGAAP